MAQLKTLTINDTGFIKLPSGTTAQRPSVPTTGMMRFNTDLSCNEYYDGSRWENQILDNLNIVSDGLVLHLDAGISNSYPGSGTTWTDLSGNGRNGTLTSGPTYNSSNGGSIVFDGVDDHILYGSNLNVGNTFTLNCWIKPTSKTRQTIFSNSYPYSANKGFFMCCPGNNSTDMFLSLGQDQKVVISSTNSIVTNNIQMVTATVNSSLSLMRLYVNGNEVSSYATQNDANISLQYDTGIFVTGKRDTTSSDLLNSNIYQLQIYNRALTATEILNNYNSLKGRFGL